LLYTTISTIRPTVWEQKRLSKVFILLATFKFLQFGENLSDAIIVKESDAKFQTQSQDSNYQSGKDTIFLFNIVLWNEIYLNCKKFAIATFAFPQFSETLSGTRMVKESDAKIQAESQVSNYQWGKDTIFLSNIFL
jgi:hypothetical protein